MAQRTRGNVLLNAYMNRYMNDQAATVNAGQKDTATAASEGAKQIAAVPTNLPEVTNYSDEIYSGIIDRDKQSRDLYEQAVKVARKLAEDAAKEAAAAAEKAARAAKSSGGSRSGSSKKSSGSSSKSSGAAAQAQLPAQSAAQSKSTDAKTAETALANAKAYKAQRAAGKNAAKTTKKTIAAVQKELDEKQAETKAAQKEGTRYAAQGGRGATTQSTDVGLASSYGAGAQARAAREAVTAPQEREQERKERQTRTREVQQRKEAYSAQQDAQRKTTLANLQADPEYARQLSQPGVRLTQTEIDAVQEYLDDQGSDYAYSRDVYDRMNRGEITREDADALLSDRSALKNKVSFGGLGQDLQAFTAGIYNSVPFLEQIMEGYEDWANEATGGQYEKITGGRTMTDVLENTEQQNALAGMAGRFAGNAALYGAANSALAGTRFAGAAATAGEKAANALRSVPGVSNLVTPGTGQAIGNVLTGQSVDLALDTVPSLVSDLYDYNTGNEEGLTPGDIAARTAGNFGVNLAMNVGAEALPSIVRGVRSGIEDTVNTVRPRETAAVGSAAMRAASNEAGDALMRYNNLPEVGYDALPETMKAEYMQALGRARQAETGLSVADTPESVRRNVQTLNDATGVLERLSEQSVALERAREISAEALKNARAERTAAPYTVDMQNAGRYTGGNEIPILDGGLDYGTGLQADDAGRGAVRVGQRGTVQEGSGNVVGGRYEPAGNRNVSKESGVSTTVRQELNRVGVTDFGMRITDDHNTFSNALNVAKSSNSNGASVDAKTPAELEGSVTFLSPDGMAGGAVEPGGNITAVFKNPNGAGKKAGIDIAYTAVANGGDRLDCYGKFLVNTYAQAGMEPVARVNYQFGINPDMDAQVRRQMANGDLDSPPDIYFMKRIDGLSLEDAAKQYAGGQSHWWTKAELDALPEMNYDDALAYRDSLIKTPSAQSAGGVSAVAQATRSTTDSVSASAKRMLPENTVGAKRQELPVGEVVPNRDYAGQQAARRGLDDEHAAQVQTFEHRAWTDAEAKAQASDDIGTTLQQNNGDFDTSMNQMLQELKEKKNWNKGDFATAQEVRDRLRVQYQQTAPDTPEFYQRAARYNDLLGTYSGQASTAGQNLQAVGMDAQGRMNMTARQIGSQFEKQNPRQAKRIAELEEELDRLRQALDARNRADMDAVDGLRGAVGDAKAPATDMDKEFGEFLEEQGIKTDPTEQFNALVAQIKKMCEDKGVSVSDEGAKEIAGMIQTGAAKESYYDKLINEAMGVTDLSLDEMAMVDDLYNKASQLPDSKERYQLEQQAIAIMANHLPARTWFEKLDNIRYLAMLGNTRTHARNLIGNVLMSAVSKGKDEVSAALQLMLPQNQRTRALYTPREMKDAAREYMNENVYSALRTGGRYNLEQGIDRARKTYGDSLVGRALQKLSDLNSNALEKEDEIFLQSAFVRSLAGNLTAKGFDPSIFTATDDASKAVLANAVQQALADAKDATFRADNALTNLLGTLGNLGDKKGTIGQKIGYILSSGNFAFTKTPANIMKTALEYTPVGGTVEAVYRGATGKGAAAVTDALAKGAVGTGLLGLGWYLADAGLITAGKDEDTEDYSEMLGTQSYSINIPGVGSYTIDWAAPSAVPLLTGAAMAEDGMDLSGVMDDPGKFAGQFADIMMGALDPVTEMSFMSSLNKTLEGLSYGDKKLTALGKLLVDSGTNYARQFVPTVLGQVARSVDPLRRSTYGGGDSATERNNTYLLQSTLNKVPGLSQSAEPYIDQWGRAEASLDGTGGDALGVAGRLAYNMLSPGYFSAENVTPVDEYVQGLYEATGDAGVLPELAPNYINVDGENTYFTPEEKTQYATARGQTAYALMDTLQDNDAFRNLTASQQAGVVKDVYALAKTVGEAEVYPDADRSGDRAYQAYLNGGETGVLNYLLGEAATDAALAEKRSQTGNADAGLSDAERWQAIAGMGLDDPVGAFLDQVGTDSAAARIYDQAGDAGVTAYMDVLGTADDDGNGTVSQGEMLLALATSGLDDVTLYDTYTAYAPEDNTAKKKAIALNDAYGTQTAAAFLEYMANYNYAKDIASAEAKARGESASYQQVAESVLDQMGLDTDTKRLFWQQTSNWAERNNPY